MANQIGLQRFLREGDESYIYKPEDIDTYWDNDYDLRDHSGWEKRYIHEANIILTVCKENAYPTQRLLPPAENESFPKNKKNCAPNDASSPKQKTVGPKG